MIKVESNIEDVLIKLDTPFKLNKDVLEEITEIGRSDIQENYNAGRSFDGSSIKPKKKGGRIFYETGELLGSIMKTVNEYVGEIFISSNRSKIASILNRDRHAFGVSKRIDENIQKLLGSKSFEELFKQ